ncbi:EF-hand domain-containing protein [Sphingomonas endolithica]|uniref:EF-hand domain-containing protein n=1 Tax=Sphingomonas endolithica TaxID=2972485 RepID=UPI0021AF993C|nr:EF-hand domain-containing protein [Sphingomonas sp. ZFBP2030]
MNKKLLIAAALATAAVGGIAVAADTLIGPRGPMAADTNKDGIVSRAEFFTAAQARFASRDSNGDRKLSGAEIDTGPRGEKLLREDTNKDGMISFAEITATESAHFKAQDANKDGRLTGEEVRPRGPGMRGRGEMGGMMLRHADTNRDGKVSRDEMRAQADQRFDRMDTNRDGVIDSAEIDAMRGPGRGTGGPGGDMPPPPPEDAGE